MSIQEISRELRLREEGIKVLTANWAIPEYRELLIYAYKRHLRLRGRGYGFMRTAMLQIATNPASAINEARLSLHSDGTACTFLDKILASTNLGDRSDVVILAVRAGADPSQTVQSCTCPLGIAVDDGRIDVMEELISRGASVNSGWGNWSMSPLSHALFKQDANAVDLLLKAGAEINSKRDLARALYSDDYELVNRLLVRGADPMLVPAKHLAGVSLDKIERLLDNSCYSLARPMPERKSLLYVVAKAVYSGKSPEWRAKLDMLMRRPVDRDAALEYKAALDKDYPQ